MGGPTATLVQVSFAATPTLWPFANLRPTMGAVDCVEAGRKSGEKTGNTGLTNGENTDRSGRNPEIPGGFSRTRAKRRRKRIRHSRRFRSGLRWKRGPLGPRRMRLPKGAFRLGAPLSDFLKHAVGFLNAENPNAASGNPAITPGKVPIQTPTMFVREAPITDKDKTPSLLISDHLITNPNGRRGRPTLNHRTISSRKAYHLVILSDMAF